MKEVILITLAAGLLAAAYVGGPLVRVIEGDATGVVWAVGALGMFGTLVARKRREWLVWLVRWDVTPTLGLLGTVIGFSVALTGLTDDNLAAKLDGIETALMTTIAGLVTHLWLLLVRRVTE